MVDYKELLVKYIKHVGINEGVNFLEPHNIDCGVFTEGEMGELRILDGQEFVGLGYPQGAISAKSYYSGSMVVVVPCSCGHQTTHTLITQASNNSDPMRWQGVQCAGCKKTYTVEVGSKDKE